MCNKQQQQQHQHKPHPALNLVKRLGHRILNVYIKYITYSFLNVSKHVSSNSNSKVESTNTFINNICRFSSLSVNSQRSPPPVCMNALEICIFVDVIEK